MRQTLFPMVALLAFFFSALSLASEQNETRYVPLLVIGSSFSNGTTPIDNRLNAPLGGVAVGAGSYLALGDALVRKTNGLVINEAEVGAGTFDRISCGLLECKPEEKWAGFDTQFKKALLRVAQYDSDRQIMGYNAKYIIIGLPNDCIHSDSFGIPQIKSYPCSLKNINTTVDKVKTIAQKALELGIVPVIITHPKFKNLDLSITQQLLGFLWIADETQYNELRYLYRDRLEKELPSAIVMNPWRAYEHRGDGLHPNRKTMIRAAKKIIRKIRNHHR